MKKTATFAASPRLSPQNGTKRAAGEEQMNDDSAVILPGDLNIIRIGAIPGSMAPYAIPSPFAWTSTSRSLSSSSSSASFSSLSSGDVIRMHRLAMPCGRRVASISLPTLLGSKSEIGEGNWKVFDTSAVEAEGGLRGGGGGVVSAVFSSGNGLVAVAEQVEGSRTAALTVYEAATGKALKHIAFTAPPRKLKRVSGNRTGSSGQVPEAFAFRCGCFSADDDARYLIAYACFAPTNTRSAKAGAGIQLASSEAREDRGDDGGRGGGGTGGSSSTSCDGIVCLFKWKSQSPLLATVAPTTPYPISKLSVYDSWQVRAVTAASSASASSSSTSGGDSNSGSRYSPCKPPELRIIASGPSYLRLLRPQLVPMGPTATIVGGSSAGDASGTDSGAADGSASAQAAAKASTGAPQAGAGDMAASSSAAAKASTITIIEEALLMQEDVEGANEEEEDTAEGNGRDKDRAKTGQRRPTRRELERRRERSAKRRAPTSSSSAAEGQAKASGSDDGDRGFHCVDHCLLFPPSTTPSSTRGGKKGGEGRGGSASASAMASSAFQGLRLVGVSAAGDVMVMGLVPEGEEEGNDASKGLTSLEWRLQSILSLRRFLRAIAPPASSDHSTASTGAAAFLTCMVPNSNKGASGGRSGTAGSAGAASAVSVGDEGGFLVCGSHGLVAFFERDGSTSSLRVKNRLLSRAAAGGAGDGDARPRGSGMIVPYSPGDPFVCVRALLLAHNSSSSSEGAITSRGKGMASTHRITAAALSYEGDAVALSTTDRGLLLLSLSRLEEECCHPSSYQYDNNGIATAVEDVYPSYAPMLPFNRVNPLTLAVLASEGAVPSSSAAGASSLSLLRRAHAGFLKGNGEVGDDDDDDEDDILGAPGDKDRGTMATARSDAAAAAAVTTVEAMLPPSFSRTASALSVPVPGLQASSSSAAQMSDPNLSPSMPSALAFGGTHTAGITSLSVASTSAMPRMITASRKDGTLRMWQWLYGKCEAVEVTLASSSSSSASAAPPTIASALASSTSTSTSSSPLSSPDPLERPLSVAIHPSGLLAAASFPSALHLYDLVSSTGLLSSSSSPATSGVLAASALSARGPGGGSGGLSSRVTSAAHRGGAGGGISKTLPQIRNASVVSYSPGGSYLALSTGSQLHIYNAFTMEPLHPPMAGHASGSPIRDLQWARNEGFVATVGDDGGISLYDVRGGRKSDDYSTVIKSIAFRCCCVVSQPSIVNALTSAAGGAASGSSAFAAALASTSNAAAAHAMSATTGGLSARGSSVFGAPPVAAVAPPPAGVAAVIAAGEAKDGSGAQLLVIVTMPTPGAAHTQDGGIKVTRIKTKSKITRLAADYPSAAVIAAVTAALASGSHALTRAAPSSLHHGLPGGVTSAAAATAVGNLSLSPAAVLKLLAQPRRVFAGTDQGDLLVYRWPLLGPGEPPKPHTSSKKPIDVGDETASAVAAKPGMLSPQPGTSGGIINLSRRGSVSVGPASSSSSPESTPRTPPPPTAAAIAAAAGSGAPLLMSPPPFSSAIFGASSSSSSSLMSPAGGGWKGEGRPRRGSNASADSVPSMSALTITTAHGSSTGGADKGRMSRSSSVSSVPSGSGALGGSSSSGKGKKWQDSLRRAGGGRGRGRQHMHMADHDTGEREQEEEEEEELASDAARKSALYGAYDDPVDRCARFRLHRGQVSGLCLTDDGRYAITTASSVPGTSTKLTKSARAKDNEGTSRAKGGQPAGARDQRGNNNEDDEEEEEDGSICILGLPYASHESVESLLAMTLATGSTPSAGAAANHRSTAGHASGGSTASKSRESLPRFIDKIGRESPSLPSPDELAALSPLDASLWWSWDPLIPRLACLYHNVTTLPRWFYEELAKRLLRAGDVVAQVQEEARKRVKRVKEAAEYRRLRLRDEADKEVHVERQRNREQVAAYEALKKESAAASLALEREHQRYLAEACNTYERRLRTEVTRYQALHDETARVKRYCEESLTAAENERKSQLRVVISAAEAKIGRQSSVIARLQEELRKREAKAAALLDEADREAEEQANRITTKLEAEKAGETTKFESSEAANRQLTRANKALTASTKEAEDALSGLRADLRATQQTVQHLERDKLILRKQVEDMTILIADREREVASLRDEKKELETYRFVLTHQLEEMKGERQPLLAQMQELRGKVGGQYDELYRHFEDDKVKEREKREKEWKTASLATEAKRLREELRQARRQLDLTIADVERIAKGPDNQLRGALMMILRTTAAASLSEATSPSRSPTSKREGKTAAGDTAGVSPRDKMHATISVYEHEQIVGELLRYQRELERKVGLQVRNVTADASRSDAMRRRVQGESLKILEEGNALRQEVVYQRRHITHLEAVALSMGGRSEGADFIKTPEPESGPRRTAAVEVAAQGSQAFTTPPTAAARGVAQDRDRATVFTRSAGGEESRSERAAAADVGRRNSGSRKSSPASSPRDSTTPSPLLVLPSLLSSASVTGMPPRSQPSASASTSSSSLSLLRQAALFPSSSTPSLTSSWKELNEQAQRYYEKLGGLGDYGDPRYDASSKDDTNVDRKAEEANAGREANQAAKERTPDATGPAGKGGQPASKAKGGGIDRMETALSSLLLSGGVSIPLSPSVAVASAASLMMLASPGGSQSAQAHGQPHGQAHGGAPTVFFGRVGSFRSSSDSASSVSMASQPSPEPVLREANRGSRGEGEAGDAGNQRQFPIRPQEARKPSDTGAESGTERGAVLEITPVRRQSTAETATEDVSARRGESPPSSHLAGRYGSSRPVSSGSAGSLMRPWSRERRATVAAAAAAGGSPTSSPANRGKRAVAQRPALGMGASYSTPNLSLASASAPAATGGQHLHRQQPSSGGASTGSGTGPRR